LKDYYQILGVRRGAGEAEIRRAYRVLVQQLHPDVNPDPAAHELIKEVNEAYDVLSDPVKKQEYDYRLESPYASVFNVPEQPQHRDPAYQRKTYYHKPTGKPTQREIMERYMHFTTKVYWAGLTLSIILITDLLLPPRIITDKITDFSSSGTVRNHADYLQTLRGEQIKISSRDKDHLEWGQQIQIVKSRMLACLIEIRVPQYGVTVTNLSSIYANFRFVLWILTLSSIVGVIGKGWIEFRFNLGIMTFFVLMFVVFLLIK
jgi:hypothetical protein